MSDLEMLRALLAKTRPAGAGYLHIDDERFPDHVVISIDGAFVFDRKTGEVVPRAVADDMFLEY